VTDFTHIFPHILSTIPCFNAKQEPHNIKESKTQLPEIDTNF